MGISLKEKIKQLPPLQQKEISVRSQELIAEERTRQQLRQLFKITQDLNGQFVVEGLNNVYPNLKFISPHEIRHDPNHDEKIISVLEYNGNLNYLYLKTDLKKTIYIRFRI
jgi:hypothetical protein